MLDEIKVNFERLICDYPSGIEVNSLLAAKYFGINKENIVVGNGAAELIKSLMQKTEGKFGISLPTFEEYPNRIPSERLVTFTPLNKDFSYSADDLISYFNDKEISLLLLINPDNPSGNYLKKKDVLLIAEWAKKRSVSLIVDESFVDFVESEESETLLNQDILAQFPDLIVIKSISKSYGVAGLRLGVLASKNRTLIDWIKKDVSIWNINSFAEFYLQIFEKYNTEYLSSLENLIEARKALYFKLSEINNLRVIPSQANFIMCEVLGEYTATYLTKEILTEHNLLIKDLSNKNGITGEYIRVAVKSQEENNKLIKAISTTLQ
jgi:histidinol-phosphate/aromatic aminotransferase/cobyric acid decarboxylase-like protein